MVTVAAALLEIGYEIEVILLICESISFYCRVVFREANLIVLIFLELADSNFHWYFFWLPSGIYHSSLIIFYVRLINIQTS